MDIQTAIISLYPDAQFAGPRGDAGYDGVRWHKKPAGITEAKVLTKLAELIAAYDALAYARSRKGEYDAMNQLEMQFDDEVNSTTTWKNAIIAIKAKYPKPE